jgi:ribokinase
LSASNVEAHLGVIREAAVLVVQLEANLEAAARALRLAKSAGAITILNPAPMRPDFDPAVLADVSILIPNESEFAALVRRLPEPGAAAGADFTEATLARMADADLHALCRRFGVDTLIVTLGARGCFVSRPGDHLHIPSLRGVEVKDTTGAGDASVGAFATALAEFGCDAIEPAARFATAAAGISVGRAGAASGMARRVEIDSRLFLEKPE